MHAAIAKSLLSAETILLLNACRSFCNEEDGRLWEGVRYDGLDWNNILQQAYRQGIAPILYHVYKKNDDNKMPPFILKILQSTYYQNIQLNMRLLSVLGSVLKAFYENKLSIILFKGPLLLHEIYPTIALRPIMDIDILVKKEDMDVINTVLNKLGYKSEPVRKWFLQDYYCVEYYHKSELMLEVHWELLHPQNFSQVTALLPSSMLWNNARPVSIGNHRALALSEEAHLLYLCLHMAKHFMKQVRLIWACDIALILQKKGKVIDWKYFGQLAKDSGQESLVREALKFVRKYIGADGKILSQDSEFRFATLGRKNFQDEKELHSTRILHRISRIPGLWEKIHSLLEYFFPNYETIAWRYRINNKQAVMLRRLFHPFLLVWHGIEEIYCRKIKNR